MFQVWCNGASCSSGEAAHTNRRLIFFIPFHLLLLHRHFSSSSSSPFIFDSVQMFRSVTHASRVAKTAIALQSVLKSTSRIQTFDRMTGSALGVATSIMHVVLSAMSVALPSPRLLAPRNALALAVDFARMPMFSTANTIQKMTNSTTLVDPRRHFVVEPSPPQILSARNKPRRTRSLLLRLRRLLTTMTMTTMMASMMLGAVTAKVRRRRRQRRANRRHRDAARARALVHRAVTTIIDATIADR